MPKSTSSARSDRLTPAQREFLRRRLHGQVAPADTKAAIPRRADRGPAPLSFAQQRLWFLDRLMPGTPLYNLCSVHELPAVDASALRRAVQAIIERHELLRTRFVEIDGEARQIVEAQVDAEFSVDDLRGHDPKQREQTLAQIVNDEAARPFDLSRAPLLRARLVQLDRERTVFVLNMHHIVSDAWSMDVFFRELQSFYSAALSGRRAELPELPIQYADFAVWQRASLSETAFAKQLDYWRKQLAELPALDLATDYPRGAIQTFAGTYTRLRFEAEELAGLRALARECGATSFVALLASFKVLLTRYTGQSDIVLGSPTAGRERSELHELIGFFVNPLVLRTQLDLDEGFRAALREVKHTVLGALDHQDLPFETVVEKIQPERDLSRSPLFQVIFQVLSQRGGSEEQARPSVELESKTAKFDLSISLWDGGGAVEGTIEYNTDLFAAATVEAMIEHWRRLLGALAAEPERAIAELPLLADNERAQLLALGRGPVSEVEAPSIHRRFEAIAARFGERAAIRTTHGELSYAELEGRANRLARRLLARGVGPGCFVALALERGLELPVAMLAVLKAGAAYLPLEPEQPAERLRAIVADAAPVLAIVADAQAGAWAELDGLPRLDLAAEAEAIAALDAAALEGDGSPDDPVYLMYTSGSTGVPKGVRVAHRGVLRLVCASDYLQIGPDDRVAQAASAAFDASTFELWGALLNGACAQIYSGELVVAPREFAAALASDEISVLFVTTALFNLLVDHASDRLAGLRAVLFGGEAVDAGRVRKLLAAGPPRVLVHAYGPTECTTFATAQRVHAGDPRQTIPIGQAIAGTSAHVVDARGQLVPLGVPGELVLGGRGLALDYWRRPQLTAERFVSLSFAGRSERVYRSGDRVRRRRDGAIEFLGRVDRQVKIRGFRIELGEIEAALVAQAGVEAAVVAVRETKAGRRLLAWLVASDGAAIDDQTLRSGLSRRLPDYMIPAALTWVEALPLTPNGKIDLAALPEPSVAESAQEQASDAPPPQGLAAVVAAIWAELLELPSVGLDGNFFDLGGHSLLLVQVQRALEDRFAVELALLELFRHPTVRSLAARLEALGASTSANVAATTPPSPTAKPAASSSARVERAQARAARQREAMRRHRPRSKGGRES